MSANLRAYTKALYRFDHVVRLVPDGAWTNPSPCEGWTAGDIVGHVIAVQRYIESLVKGTAPTLNPYESPGRFAGSNPVAAWESTVDDVLAALDQPAVINRVVQTFRAEEPIDAGIGWNVVDTLTHTWDLARAAGVDDRLDANLVDHALREALPMIENMRHPPFFGDAVDDRCDADPQTRLLCMLGRSPTGRPKA